MGDEVIQLPTWGRGSGEVSIKQREQANIIIACSHQKFYLNIIANNPSSEQD
jgi:hypothetical protein